jgi:hypothetical protein
VTTRNERLHASRWRRTFDGSAIPEGAADLVRERVAGREGRVLVLGGDLDGWLPALAEAGLRAVGMHPSRVALAALRERLADSLLAEGRVALVHGDMRDFEPLRDACAVVAPAPALAALGSEPERSDTLAGLADTLPSGAPLLVWLEAPPADVMEVGERGGVATLPPSLAFEDPLGAGTLVRHTTVTCESSRGRVLLRHAYLGTSGEEAAAEGDLLSLLEPAQVENTIRAAGFGGVERITRGAQVILVAERT